MILIKRIKNILFFLLLSLLILYLLNVLGIIGFMSGLFKSLFPIIAGLFFSICMESIISRFIKKGYKRKMITIVLYLLVIICVVTFLAITIAPFIEQMKVFINTLPSLINEIEILLKKFNININTNSLLNNLQIRMDKIIEYFSNSMLLKRYKNR